MTRQAVPDLAWWRADPERWELLAFDKQQDADGRPFDPCWEDREQVLEALFREPLPEDHAFARYLLVQETAWHGHTWGFCHSIELAALLVADARRVEDVWLLWEAVPRSFDTWCGLPHQLLLASGIAETAAYVRASEHPQRDNLLGHLAEISGTTDDAVAQHLAGRHLYYRDAFDELAHEQVTSG